MPTQLPTKNTCLNCNHSLEKTQKYCPNCGQENADKHLKLGLLLKDVIASEFNLESKLLRTVPAFLFRPGKLTNEFLAGRRVHFIHPFKLYFLSSLLFFFVVLRLSSPTIEKGLNQVYKEAYDNKFSDGLEISFDNEENEKKEVLSDSTLQVLDSLIKAEVTSESISIDSLKDLKDKLANNLPASLEQNIKQEAKKKVSRGSKFLYWIQEKNMTKEALLDSMNQRQTNTNLFIAEKCLKIGRNDPIIFVTKTVQNIATLMFFTLPILAMSFVPFYIRRKKLYIDHLIFSLHLQALTFLMLTLISIFVYFELEFGSLLFLFVLMIYAWFAFKNVYKQGFFNTTIKYALISSIYVILHSLLITVDLVYSFVMF